MQQTIELTPVTVLTATLELLKNEDAWTKKAFARDGLDQLCSPSSEHACKYCLIGAMRKVCGTNYGAVLKAMVPLIETIQDEENGGSIPTWQDSDKRRHRDIIEALTKTIDRLSKK